MYIFQPQWLVKHGIIEKGTEVAVETNLTQPGFRFRFPKGKAIWSIAPNRLVVESRDPETDCGQMVAKILKVLPETPLFALGNNAHYQAEPSELENLPEAIREFPPADLPTPEQSVVDRTFQLGVKRDDYQTVNLQISLKEDLIELACNVHAELAHHEKANEEALDAAKQFFQDRTETTSLAQHVFGTLFDDDTSDS